MKRYTEKREKGCDVCNENKPVYSYPIYVCEEQHHEDVYINDTDFKICPMCGRKLGD